MDVNFQGKEITDIGVQMGDAAYVFSLSIWRSHEFLVVYSDAHVMTCQHLEGKKERVFPS